MSLCREYYRSLLFICDMLFHSSAWKRWLRMKIRCYWVLRLLSAQGVGRHRRLLRLNQVIRLRTHSGNNTHQSTSLYVELWLTNAYELLEISSRHRSSLDGPPAPRNQSKPSGPSLESRHRVYHVLWEKDETGWTFAAGRFEWGKAG